MTIEEQIKSITERGYLLEVRVRKGRCLAVASTEFRCHAVQTVDLQAALQQLRGTIEVSCSQDKAESF